MTFEEYVKEELELIQGHLARIDEIHRSIGFADKVLVALEVVIPFGKYQGWMLGEVSLKYLDQTISSMPEQWLVHCARLVVEGAGYRWRLKSIPDSSYWDFRDSKDAIEAEALERFKNEFDDEE